MDKRIFRMNKGNATDVRVDLLSSENGVEIYRVTMAFSENTVPSRVHIDWEEPMVNLLHVWHPTGGRDHAMRQWFSATSTHSDFCFGAPVLCTIGEGGKNTETVAVSDPCTPINISYAVKDLDQRDTVGYTVSFFTGNCSAMTDYTADIRIDRRPVRMTRPSGPFPRGGRRTGTIFRPVPPPRRMRCIRRGTTSIRRPTPTVCSRT